MYLLFYMLMSCTILVEVKGTSFNGSLHISRKYYCYMIFIGGAVFFCACNLQCQCFSISTLYYWVFGLVKRILITF